MHLPENIWYEIYKFDSTYHETFKKVIKNIDYFKVGNYKFYKKYINLIDKKIEWSYLFYEAKTFDEYYNIYENLPLIIQKKYKINFGKSIKIRDVLYEKIKSIIQLDFMHNVFILQYEIKNNKNLYQLSWI